jgi:hypothetical protein
VLGVQGGQGVFQRARIRRRADPQPARLSGGVCQSHHAGRRGVALFPRHVGGGVAQRAACRVARKTDHKQFLAGVDQLCLAAQHEHLQPLERGRKQVGAAREPDVVGAALEADEARKHAALRIAIGRQPRMA